MARGHGQTPVDPPLPMPAFDHIHINSVNPEASLDWYSRYWPKGKKTTYAGFPAFFDEKNFYRARSGRLDPRLPVPMPGRSGIASASSTPGVRARHPVWGTRGKADGSERAGPAERRPVAYRHRDPTPKSQVSFAD
jgi:hypothetical protein